MRRALRCDGIIPQYRVAGREPEPADARAALDWLAEHDAAADFDFIADGETPADDAGAAAATASAWAEAGCTWWLETRWEARDQMRDRLVAGPPRG